MEVSKNYIQNLSSTLFPSPTLPPTPGLSIVPMYLVHIKADDITIPCVKNHLMKLSP